MCDFRNLQPSDKFSGNRRFHLKSCTCQPLFESRAIVEQENTLGIYGPDIAFIVGNIHPQS